MSYPPPQNPQGQPPPGYPPPGYPPPAYPPPGYPPPGNPYPGSAPPGYGPPGPPAPPGYGTPNPEKGPRRYNIFQALVLFYLPNLWRDVGQRWKGIGLTYLFLLLLITWLPVFIKGHHGLSKFVREEAPKVTSQIPQVIIKNGVVSIDRPEPYSITDPDTGTTLAIIDTTGDTTAPPPNSPSVLLTRSSLVMRKSPSEIQTTDLSQVQYFQLDAKRVQGWVDNFEAFYWLAYPLLTIFSWIWRLFLMLIFAAIGVAMASGVKAPLSYAGLLRLSAIAMTPVIWIDTLMTFVPGLNLGCGWWFGGLVVDLVVLFFAVRANAPQSPQPPAAYGGYSGAPGFPVAPPSPQPWPPAPPT